MKRINTSTNHWKPKENDFVVMCHDGKFSRAQLAKVVKVEKNHFFVQFRDYENSVKTFRVGKTKHNSFQKRRWEYQGEHWLDYYSVLSAYQFFFGNCVAFYNVASWYKNKKLPSSKSKNNYLKKQRNRYLKNLDVQKYLLDFFGEIYKIKQTGESKNGK